MKLHIATLWKKIQFWKKPKLNKKTYVEGQDYEFVPAEEDLLTVKLLTGKFKNVVYFYGSVSIAEEGQNAKLSFDYTIIDSGRYTVESLTDDQDFSRILGDILVTIITVEEEKDATRNYDFKESDLL
jgi:hypothetical protein